jgi:negative regulator of sigma E activity
LKDKKKEKIDDPYARGEMSYGTKEAAERADKKFWDDVKEYAKKGAVIVACVGGAAVLNHLSNKLDQPAQKDSPTFPAQPPEQDQQPILDSQKIIVNL